MHNLFSHLFVAVLAFLVGILVASTFRPSRTHDMETRSIREPNRPLDHPRNTLDSRISDVRDSPELHHTSRKEDVIVKAVVLEHVQLETISLFDPPNLLMHKVPDMLQLSEKEVGFLNDQLNQLWTTIKGLEVESRTLLSAPDDETIVFIVSTDEHEVNLEHKKFFDAIHDHFSEEKATSLEALLRGDIQEYFGYRGPTKITFEPNDNGTFKISVERNGTSAEYHDKDRVPIELRHLARIE